MKKYKRLKNSTIDNNMPENYAKIGITKQEKKRGYYNTFNGFTLSYCSIGVCDSEVKPCGGYFGGCPYYVRNHHEQPHKNTKKYDAFVEERTLHLTQLALQTYWDDRLEKVINGEATEEERKEVATKLSYKMSDWQLKEHMYLHLVIRKAWIIKQQREKDEKIQKIKKEQEEKKVLFEIGDYFYIKISHMPEIKDKNGKSLWYKGYASDGWVLKSNFTKYFHSQLQKQQRYNLREEYSKNLKLLDKELEENYGMITMFKLLDE